MKFVVVEVVVAVMAMTMTIYFGLNVRLPLNVSQSNCVG